MPRTRYTIVGEIEVLSPLHVGTGDVRHPTGMRTPKDANTAPEVAAILRDAAGNPCIGGSTLKGLLRRTGEALGLGDARIEALFGSIKELEGGRTGALTAFASEAFRPGPAQGLPFADPRAMSEGGFGPGVFVAARTRIDRAGGAASGNTLFHQEMVAPGAIFGLRLSLDRRAWAERDDRDGIAGFVDEARPQAAKALSDLLLILAEWAVPDGLALGKGQADGQGRVQLRPATLKVERLVLDETGAFRRDGLAPAETALPKARGFSLDRTASLRLACEDPFLIVDSSFAPREEGERKVQVGGQIAADGLALVMGSSVAGAMRARAAWLVALDAHRACIEAGTAPPDRSPDDPDTPYEQGGRRRSLTPIERLFGVTGFRALLEIRRVTVTAGELCAVTSVKLDRFSGAPVDNALFTTEAFAGTRIALALTLAGRPSMPVEPEDGALFDRLVADLRRNGLTLGHGGNKGFGWFTVSEAR